MTVATEPVEIDKDLRSLLFSEDAFWPAEPKSIVDTGLSSSFIEALLCKYLANYGTTSGRAIAEAIGLPHRLLTPLIDSLRTRQLVVHVGAAPFNDYYYTLSEQGRVRARSYLEECAYVGPAPVPLPKYVTSVDAQSITVVAPSGKNSSRLFKGSRSSPSYLLVSAPPLTPVRECSCLAHQATANRPSPGN